MRYVSIILLFLIISGCKEKVTPEPYTYSQLISGSTFKVWKAEFWKLREEGKADLSSGFPDCDEDNLYYFYADEVRTFEVHAGREHCEGEDPDEELLVQGSWAVVNAKATLEMVIPFFSTSSLPWTLENLEEDEFEVAFHFNDEKSIVVFFELEDEGN